ncbi:MAG: hypothetical protein JW954_07520 [Dehalococcoidaceae bacterium]|nr:hypothetical protein [Dehalococcoidaceae bacterium]
MTSSRDLITGYSVHLDEDHHSPTSGRYSVRLVLNDDISQAMPYLNAKLTEKLFDRENSILIGTCNGRRYAFRPREIQVGIVDEAGKAVPLAEAAVELVNCVWSERENIAPDYNERDLPPVFEVFKLLPGTNCRECGCPTCLACAVELRNGAMSIPCCPVLGTPQYSENRQKLQALLNK